MAKKVQTQSLRFFSIFVLNPKISIIIATAHTKPLDVINAES